MELWGALSAEASELVCVLGPPAVRHTGSVRGWVGCGTVGVGESEGWVGQWALGSHP